MDIGGKHLDRYRVEPSAPGGHHAVAGVRDLRGQRRAIAAIEPDRIGQIGRAEFAFPLGIGPVTDRAIGSEYRCTAAGRSACLVLSRDGPDIGYDVCHRARIENPVATEGGHLRLRVLVMAGLANTVGQRVFDRLEIAAPQPVIVIEIGIALAARRTRAVALDALDLECRTSAFDRRVHQRGCLRASVRSGSRLNASSIGARRFASACISSASWPRLDQPSVPLVAPCNPGQRRIER